MSLFGRRERREIAELEEYVDRLRAERDTARAGQATAEFNREQILRQLAEADAANRRLHGRNLELGRQVSALAESDLEYAAHLERRKTSLEKAGHRILAAWRREQKRADHLQQRLDDAVGLSTTIVDSGRWQPGYKPAPKPEVAS